MDNVSLIVAAMAEECCGLLNAVDPVNAALPRTLQPKHLLWMARQISVQVDQWPATKLHRWIGYVQCGMVANHILDFEGALAMFKRIRQAHNEGEADQDLIDHLNPDHVFRLEIGGES